MWVSAIDDACMPNLFGTFWNYSVEFARNFGDWDNGSEKDSLMSIEDITSCKVHKVYEVTGLPMIAS